MKTLAILTDIHGCKKTLDAMLKKLPADAEIICLGDMIDRGPDSKGVIEWAMRNSIRCCLGNHEHMMVDFLDSVKKGTPSQYMDGIWFMNGGSDCAISFGQKDSPMEFDIPDAVHAWMAALPTYIIHNEFPHVLLSHTGWGMHPDRLNSVWCRGQEFPDDKYFRVFGHTQQKEPFVNDRFAMIDTGCAYTNRGMGVLTAFIVPTGEIIQQKNIE